MENSKKILLHICCAPCATSAIEFLEKSFNQIELFYYNPNISPKEEAEKRFAESQKLKQFFPSVSNTIKGDYDFSKWNSVVSPLAKTGEGGERCYECYNLRLVKSFEKALEISANAISTTLFSSPFKNKEWLLEIGKKLEKKYGIEFIAEKFDYKRSIELSKQFGFYRQNYCGCHFSMAERNERLKNKNSGGK